MKPEDQRTAIAESCGLNTQKEQVGGILCYRDKHGHMVASLPDYLNDLNAMHSAEDVLTNAQRRAYVASLVNVHPLHYAPTVPSDDKWMHIYFLVNATAAQRAEAFLRCIGKWIDKPYYPVSISDPPNEP